MTKQEFTSVIVYITGAYNNFNVDHLVWYDMLKELDYSICLQAVKNVIKIAKYPLTIAAINEEYNLLVKSKLREETDYLLGIAKEMLDKGLISNDLHCEIEIEITYDDKISDRNKQILLDYKKQDNKLIQILKGKEQQLCLTNKS